MRRVILLLLLVVGACAAQPPERTPLPDVAEVVPEPVGCQLSVGDPKGVTVLSVAADGAAVGSLEANDVITEIEGVPTPTRPELSAVMADHGPGETVRISFTRDGVEDTVAVELAPNPADPGRGLIGITVQTAYDQIGLDEADDVVTPSTTGRVIEIGRMVMIFDPMTRAWQPTGIETPETSTWATTSTGLYAATESVPVGVLDLSTDEKIPDDGFRDWDLIGLVGSVGDVLVAFLTQEIPDQPGYVSLALGGFDPQSGTTGWVTPVSPTNFGLPATAYGSPDHTAFIALGVDTENREPLGVGLFDDTGSLQSSTAFEGLGQPVGWFDDHSVAFRTSGEVVTVVDLVDATTDTYSLPQNMLDADATTVGDGRHLLITGDRSLQLQDLFDPNVNYPLASDCAIGRLGDPGWGM